MHISFRNKIVLVFVVFAVLYAGIFYYHRKATVLEQGYDPDVPAIKAAMAQEFQQSYPVTVEPGTVREFDLVAQPAKYTGIDDHVLEGYTYNGQVPGPVYRITHGDTLRLNFTNNLPEETTIHFHGIRVPNAMDGVPGVTQDPVAPGGTFVYEFTPKDAGTYWYHPHVRSSEQVEKGLYGVIIVEERDNPGYSQDIVWVVDDWRVTPDYQIEESFNTMHDLMHDGRWGQVVTVNGKTVENLSIRPGEHLRVRIVNVSNARDYRLDFGGLTARAIAVDGMPLENPFDAGGFELAPGNRVDVDVSAPARLAGQQVSVTDTFTRVTNTLAAFDVLTDSVTEQEPQVLQLASYPDWSAAGALEPDYEYVLDAQRGGMMSIQWTINGEAYPDGTKTTLQSGTFYKLRLRNNSYRLHPMHLHGQFFQVLARDGAPVTNPYWQDTVLVKSQETVDIGIVPVDIGSWMYHCHALEHAESGMMSVIEVI